MTTTVEVLAAAFRDAGTPFIVGHPGGESVELMEAARQRQMRFLLIKQEGAGAMLAALALAACFWWPLVRGGGFVGGDVYSYYLPQKVVYAEHLRQSELPLWNERAGHGYPIVGESQTGAFYPPNAVLYRMFDLNTAYNFNHLLHYLLAFVFTWMYARAIGLSPWSAALTGLVFVYGWFPSR